MKNIVVFPVHSGITKNPDYARRQAWRIDALVNYGSQFKQNAHPDTVRGWEGQQPEVVATAKVTIPLGANPPLPIMPMKKGITWGQELGIPECPYAKRWVLNLGLFSIRVHHFMRSDDKRYLHDHPWWYLTFVVKGGYNDMQESGPVHLKAPRIAFRRANHAHYVDPDDGGVWTILLTGREKRVWGFWVKGKFKKAYRYFFDYGHPPCEQKKWAGLDTISIGTLPGAGQVVPRKYAVLAKWFKALRS